MANKKNTPRNGTQDNADQQFEDFLRRQFTALKRELDAHAATTRKDGKKLVLPGGAVERPHGGNSRVLKFFDSYKYGIAAAVLVAVAVPMVIQLNRQKFEERQIAEVRLANAAHASENAKVLSNDSDAAPEIASPSARRPPQTKNDVIAQSSAPQAKNIPRPQRDTNLPSNSKTLARKKSTIAETKPASEGDADNALALRAAKEEEKDSPLAAITMAPKAAPAAAPQADDARSGAAAPPQNTERGAMARAESASTQPDATPPTTPTTRSIRIENNKARMKRQEIAEDAEKQEMEKLWKEFEKNPKSFAKDRKRRTRLKVLLVRYNQKSRSNKLANLERDALP